MRQCGGHFEGTEPCIEVHFPEGREYTGSTSVRQYQRVSAKVSRY